MNKITEARIWAAVLHAGQEYDKGEPYTVHLAEVVAVLERFRITDETTVIAAWLHDAVEDTGAAWEEILDRFGIGVATIVHAVTNEPGANRRERHARTYPKIRMAGSPAIAVKLADRIANWEHSLKTKDRRANMYCKEYPAFRSELYAPYPVVLKMWMHLDDLYANTLPHGAK
jgi:(p)ppGpp synthase/HD superfamily hydrolase